MKKLLIWLLCVVLAASMAMIGISCKAETVEEVEEAAEEVEEAAEEVEEVTGKETTEETLTTVKVGSMPYSMYQVCHTAKELGFDKELGLDYVIREHVGPQNQMKELARKELDIVVGSIAEFVPVIKTMPEARLFSPLDLFLGFLFIGRAGEWKPWDELVDEMGAEKAKEYRLNEFKGKGFVGTPFRFLLINDMLSQIDLTQKDYTQLTYADDQLAAAAFIGGEGDTYTGSLPQEIRLLKDFNGEYVNLGGQEILGPMGLWYGNIITSEKFLKENREICLKYLAIQYRLNKLFNEDPTGKIAEIYNDNLNRKTGSGNTVEEFAILETVYDKFITIEWAKDNYFNPESPYYWRISADYNIKVAVENGILDEVVPADDYMPQEDIFNELLTREDLMEFINKPMSQ